MLRDFINRSYHILFNLLLPCFYLKNTLVRIAFISAWVRGKNNGVPCLWVVVYLHWTTTVCGDWKHSGIITGSDRTQSQCFILITREKNQFSVYLSEHVFCKSGFFASINFCEWRPFWHIRLNWICDLLFCTW